MAASASVRRWASAAEQKESQPKLIKKIDLEERDQIHTSFFRTDAFEEEGGETGAGDADDTAVGRPGRTGDVEACRWVWSETIPIADELHS